MPLVQQSICSHCCKECAHCFLFCFWSQPPCFLYAWVIIMQCQFYANEKLLKSLVLQWCKPRATECWIRAACECNCVGFGEKNSEKDRHKTFPKLTSKAFMGTSDHLCFKILHVVPLLKHVPHTLADQNLCLQQGPFPAPVYHEPAMPWLALPYCLYNISYPPAEG